MYTFKTGDSPNCARTVKMVDLPLDLVLEIFRRINIDENGEQQVKIYRRTLFTPCSIVTDKEPKDLIYPEGWYYVNGKFSNKYNSSTRSYQEVFMLNKYKLRWSDLGANYCTYN